MVPYVAVRWHSATYNDVRRRCNWARWFQRQRSHIHCVVVRRRT